MNCKKIHIKNLMMRGKKIFFQHQKEKNDKMEKFEDNADERTSNVPAEMIPGTDNKMAQDLMRLVSDAIDEWANLYEMNNLPKKIIFQQALTILNAVNALLFK